METFGPLVPYLLGFALVATFGVLLIGVVSFAFNRDFHAKHGNTLMRARVVGQAVALVLFAVLVFFLGRQ